MANHLCFIDKGRIIKEISKEELDAECSKCIAIKVFDVKKATTVLEKDLKVDNYKVIDDEEIRIYDYLDNSAKVNKVLAENNVDVKSIYEAGISLEEYFENLVKDGVK